MNEGARIRKLKVLITVKTYPIPSAKYDELVCTAGVTEEGDFIRLYPINFRDLPFVKQYKKYQWIEVSVTPHINDVRKESYRPECDSIAIIGEPIPPNPGNWGERAKYALAKKALSLEQLQEQQRKDKTSLGVFKPKIVHDLVIKPDTKEWRPQFLNALKQSRLFEYRKNTLVPPRKVPYKLQYFFECADKRCKSHKMMIEDWELGALFWRLVDKGMAQEEAVKKVKNKFLDDLCSPKKDTHFFVGTVSAHPTAWVVIGVFHPKAVTVQHTLFK